jgi:hypothetical protein
MLVISPTDKKCSQYKHLFRTNHLSGCNLYGQSNELHILYVGLITLDKMHTCAPTHPPAHARTRARAHTHTQKTTAAIG